MKTFLLLLLLCVGCLAKDPPCYCAYGILKEPMVYKGQTFYVLMAVDGNGNKAFVSVSEATILELNKMVQATAISFEEK